MSSRLYKISKEELQETLDKATGYINALRLLGIGGNSSKKTLEKLIKKIQFVCRKIRRKQIKSN